MPGSIRRRTALVAVVASALALTACSGSPSGVNQPTLSNESTTITLNWWGADARNKLTEQAVAAFEKAHPKIHVEMTNADWNGYWDKLATSTAGGNAPDVSQFDQLYVASYAQRGTLLDLSTVSNLLKTKALSAASLDTGKVAGKLYAMPIGVTPEGVMINTTVLEKYGIAVPDTSTWTWDQFDALASQVTQKSGGAVHGLSPFGGDSFSLGVWARQHGNNVFGAGGKVTLKPAVLASYWQKELDWIASGAAPSASALSEKVNVPLEQGDLATGKTAMGFIPAGQFSTYQATAPDQKLVLADWPKDSGSEAGYQYLKPSMYWSISSKTKHPAEAAALVDYLVNSPEAGKILGIDRGVPSNPQVQSAIAGSLSAADKANLDFTKAMTKTAGKAPAITPNGASTIETSLARFNQQVQFKQTTPQAAAKAFLDDLKNNITSAG